MIKENGDRYLLSVILYIYINFFCILSVNWENCFEDKQGILEINTWC